MPYENIYSRPIVNPELNSVTKPNISSTYGHFHGFTCTDEHCTGDHGLTGGDHRDGGGDDGGTGDYLGTGYREWWNVGEDALPVMLGIAIGVPIGAIVMLVYGGLRR